MSIGIILKINCTISGTVHIFFLKKSYLSPRCPKLHNFFFLVQFFHNIYLSNGLGVTIGTPSWPKLKKCVKKVLFCLSQICKYLGYPPLGGAFVSKFWPWRPLSNFISLCIHVDYTLFKFQGKIFIGDVTVTVTVFVTVVRNKIWKLAQIWENSYKTGSENFSEFFFLTYLKVRW